MFPSFQLYFACSCVRILLATRSALSNIFTYVAVGEQFYAEKANGKGLCREVRNKAAASCPMCAVAIEHQNMEDETESALTYFTCAGEGGHKLPAFSEKFDLPLMCGSGEEAPKFLEGDGMAGAKGSTGIKVARKDSAKVGREGKDEKMPATGRNSAASSASRCPCQAMPNIASLE